jgi:NADP-dependent 3-hydroxy acid dehydrogenase YdfG
MGEKVLRDLATQKVVLITGSSSGIGRACASFLAQNGFIVYAGTRDTSKLKDIKHKNLFPIFLDIKDNINIQKVIEKILLKHRKIDILINKCRLWLSINS